ncbi:hypothetical protein A2U01_0071419, partial [Trifolium medium]|nr:hypothetical protein [Trifolium medium]
RVAPFCEQAVGVVSGKCASRSQHAARRARGEFESEMHNGNLRVAQGMRRGAPVSVLRNSSFSRWKRGL